MVASLLVWSVGYVVVPIEPDRGHRLEKAKVRLRHPSLAFDIGAVLILLSAVQNFPPSWRGGLLTKRLGEWYYMNREGDPFQQRVLPA
jgi:hypothetical protein